MLGGTLIDTDGIGLHRERSWRGALWLCALVAFVAFVAFVAGCAGTSRPAAAPAPAAPTAGSTVAPAPAASGERDVAPAHTGADSARDSSLKARPAKPAAPVPFERAVLNAADALFDAAARSISLSGPPRELIVDPIIDASTGQHTVAGVRVAKMLSDEVSTRRTWLAPRAFDEQVLARSPLLLLGTLTAIDAHGDAGARSNTFALTLALVDLASGRVVARARSRAFEDSVDAQPTAFFRDAPFWRRDLALVAHTRTVHRAGPQDGRGGALTDEAAADAPGDNADPAYLAGLPVALVVARAITAYQDGRYRDALGLFRQAGKLADASDTRVLNGLYLSAIKAGQPAEADKALARFVGAGLEDQGLSLAIRFAPGSVQFAPDVQARSQYSSWLRAIARLAAAKSACLAVIGHASHVGTLDASDELTARRAVAIRQRLEASAPRLRGRVSASGAGFRKTLVGLGSDDLRDALDRRVEFMVEQCP